MILQYIIHKLEEFWRVFYKTNDIPELLLTRVTFSLSLNAEKKILQIS